MTKPLVLASSVSRFVWLCICLLFGLACPGCGGTISELKGNSLPQFPADNQMLIVPVGQPSSGSPTVFTARPVEEVRDDYAALWARQFTAKYHWDFGNGATGRYQTSETDTVTMIPLLIEENATEAQRTFSGTVRIELTSKPAVPAGGGASSRAASGNIAIKTYAFSYTVMRGANPDWDIAGISGPLTVSGGQKAVYIVELIGSPRLEDLNYIWKVDNDNASLASSATQEQEISFTNTSNKPAVVNLSVEVFSKSNSLYRRGPVSLTITIHQADWDIIKIAGPGDVGNTQKASYAVLLSGDPPLADLGYAWQVNGVGASFDSSSSSDPEITFSNNTNSKIEVRLSVEVFRKSNSLDRRGPVSLTITIHQTDWSIIGIQAPDTVLTGQSAKLSVMLGGSPPPADELGYFWEFEGGGTDIQNSTIAEPTLSFTNTGLNNIVMTVELKVYRKSNANDQRSAAQKTILIKPLSWEIGPISAPEHVLNGQTVTFSVPLLGAAPEAGDLGYIWEFSGPGILNPLSTEVTPVLKLVNTGTDDISIHASVTVYRKSNPSDKRKVGPKEVTVAWTAWDIAFVVFPAQVNSGQKVKLSVALQGTPPPADDLGYFWQFGDGADMGSSTQAEPEITLTNSDTDPSKSCPVRVRVYRKSNPTEARPSMADFKQEAISILYKAPAP